MIILLQTLAVILVSAIAIGIAYRIGRRQGGNDVLATERLRYTEVIEETYVIPGVLTEEVKKVQFEGVKREMANVLGCRCLNEGLIHFERKENDWTSPSGVKYDKLTATMTVRKPDNNS